METPKIQRIITTIPQTPVANRTKHIVINDVAVLSTPTIPRRMQALTDEEQEEMNKLEAITFKPNTVGIYTIYDEELHFYSDDAKSYIHGIHYGFKSFCGIEMYYAPVPSKGYFSIGHISANRIVCGIGCYLVEEQDNATFIHVDGEGIARFMLVEDVHYEAYTEEQLKPIAEELSTYYYVYTKLYPLGHASANSKEIMLEFFDGISAIYYRLSHDDEDECDNVSVKIYPNVWNGKCKYHPERRYRHYNRNIETFICIKLAKSKYTEKEYNIERSKYDAQKHNITPL